MPSSPLRGPIPAVAEAFHRRMTSGRNGALLLSVRDEQGQSAECVVKIKGLMENPSLHPVPALAEWLAAALARELGVPCPRSFKVEITAEFAASVTDSVVSQALSKSIGPEYGAEFMRGLSAVRSDLLDRSLRPVAAHLLAFDLFIHNPDRRAENPNLLGRRDDFVALDHGDAFTFVLPTLFAQTRRRPRSLRISSVTS